ncbi:hypothetical protein C446_03264 [Halobiforma nitratireducens JCM 10879]|uniref:Uncharacterized protein n=1 Tax=Halobiforma nitratireducens JCM 10879 TaxID=1227454 RepID=M0MCM2_9EURY|nr:hypothetical protein C446_03264 [Halobiforma nitratireducens JCM 10879]
MHPDRTDDTAVDRPVDRFGASRLRQRSPALTGKSRGRHRRGPRRTEPDLDFDLDTESGGKDGT